MRLNLTFLIAITLLMNCSEKEIANSAIYLGTYRVADQLIPYPYIIKIEKDSIFLFDKSGICIDKRTHHLIESNEEITFKEKQLKVLDKKENQLIVFDLLDTTNFRTFTNGKPNPKYAAKFRKLIVGDTLDVLQIQKEIKNFIWKYDLVEDDNSNPNHNLEIEQLLNFENDSVSIITNYFYEGLKTVSERETKAYHIFEIDSISFLSFEKGSNNPQSIHRITGYDSQKIELEDYSSRVYKSISFHNESIKIDAFKEQLKNTSAYANCYDGYQGEYNYEDVTFNKGNEFIANYVSENLPQTETKSGYIIIHFNINCNGDIGNFGLIQMNNEYKETAFSKEVVKHLINRVSELKDFPSSESQSKWLNFKDVHAFLMFKLEQGKITDVCP